MKKSLLLAGALLLFAGSSQAQYDYMNSIAGRWGVAGNAGYALYAMNNVNSDIDNVNNFVTSLGGSSLEKITGGLNVNASVFYGLTDYLLLGMEFGGLNAYTENEAFPGELQSYYVSGLEFGVFGKAVFPVEETFLWTLGLGLIGVTTSDAEYHLAGTGGGTLVQTYKGTAAGVKIMGGGEWFLTPYMAVGAEIGYRYAKIEEVTDRDEIARWVNGDGSNFTIDYSGPYGQGGIRVYF